MDRQASVVEAEARWRRSSAALLAAALVVAALHATAMVPLVGNATANGTSTIVMDRVQGPYRVVVGIIPARPVTPQTHLAIQVFSAVDERLLRDTEVRLRVAATGPVGAAPYGPELALNDQSLRYFETDVPFNVTGPWNLTLSVASGLGEEEFALRLEVEEPRAGVQWIWIAGLLAAIFAVGAWTWLTLRRRNSQ